MKSFKRSFGKDKDKDKNQAAHRPAMMSVPPPSGPPDLSKKMPPKGIIKAIENYTAQHPDELSISKGDFFHVLGEGTGPDGQECFDATNPLSGARGLVPKQYSEVLGRNKAASAGPTPSSAGFGMQDLAGALPAGATSPPSAGGASQFANYPSSSSAAAAAGPGAGATPLSPQSKAQSLYGQVRFDFEAQRPDELDARKGENIILIAQSNQEWFVAKPIGRLGGPGLIPVSYVLILNMATGKPLDPATVEEMVRGGCLPPVEEWKKNTAEYKQRSIPLGKFDFGQPSASAQQQQQSAPRSATPASHQRSQSQASTHQGHHYRTDSFASQQQQQSRPSTSASYSRESAGDPYFTAQPGTGETTPPSHVYDNDEAARYGLIAQASVDSFHQEEGAFWFLMRCAFTSSYSLVLYRSYEDFFEFQMSLMDDLPVEAGKEVPAGSRSPPQRIIPRLPGPVQHVDEVTCAQRQVDLTIYLKQLCALPGYVRSHFRFYEFFLPRSGDVEVTPPQEDFVQPEQAENEVVEYLDRMPGSHSVSPDGETQQRYSSSSQQQPRDSQQQLRSPVDRESYGAAYPGSNSTTRPGSAAASLNNQFPNGRSSRGSTTSSHARGASYSTRSPATDSMSSPWGSSAALQQPQQQQPQSAPAFIKIKIFHRNTDDLIAIRVPPNVGRQALLDKTRERLGNDVEKLRYREDIPPHERIGSTSARLIELHSDEDLAAWVRSGKKQVLYVD